MTGIKEEFHVFVFILFFGFWIFFLANLIKMTIALGFVGLSAGYSWAGTAHLPGLRLIKDSPYKIAGVVNSSVESAKKSVEKNNLDGAQIYSSVESLSQSKNIDVVVVSVKVPEHYKLVSGALEGGKDVICEWPLGNGLAEAEQLVQLANKKGVKAGIVLQARKSPIILKAKELIESDAIGRIISTNFKGHEKTFGQFFPASYSDYLLYKKNGASMLTIPCGHDLDALAFVLGEFEWLNGYVSSQFSDVDLVKTSDDSKIEKTGITIRKDIADQVLIQGKLLSGATASVHIRGQQNSDLTREEGLRWEIHGSQGDIVITSTSCLAELSKLSIHMSQLDENGNSTATVDLSEEHDPVVDNLKTYYESYAKKETGVHVPPQFQNSEGFPTFEDALIRHRQIQAIIDSSKSGSRKSYIV
jgi:predicted dehydrogenase